MNLSKAILIGLLLYGINKKMGQESRSLTNRAASLAPFFNQINIKEIIDEAFAATLKKQETIPVGIDESLLTERQRKLLQPQPDHNAVEASKWLPLIKHPSVIVILGKRGSGKSALAYRLLEHMRWVSRIFIVGLPSSAHKNLPNWIEVQPELEDVPPDSVVLVDESYIQYSARSSMTSQAKELSQILNLSRQRGQTLVFVSQESRQIDRNILSAANVVIFKEPSLFQAKLDRHELLDLVTQATQAFQSITANRKKWSFVFTHERGCVGLIENSPPSFWSEKLSCAFASEKICKVRTAKKLTLAERQIQAKEYGKKGFIPAQIAKIMGLSKATIKNYLEDYPYKGGATLVRSNLIYPV